MTNIEAASIDRLCVKFYSPEEDSKFCLAGLQAYETDNPDHNKKIADLLDGRMQDESTKKAQIYACGIGNCTMRLTTGPEVGRKFEGECRAASYCLKQTFEAVSQTPTVEEGQKLYRDIYESLDGFVGGGSAGNFCPRLDCDLSAGLSEDMVPGTAGECHIGDPLGQPMLPLDEA